MTHELISPISSSCSNRSTNPLIAIVYCCTSGRTSCKVIDKDSCWWDDPGRATSMIESLEDCAGKALSSTTDAIKCLTVCKKDKGAQSPTNITLPCASRRMRPSRGTTVSSGCSSLLMVGESEVPITAVPSWLRRGVECAVLCSSL